MQATKHRTGLAIHGAVVALSSSRAATSHLRRRFQHRYRGRYRFARAVFAFDTALLAIGLALLVVNIVFVTAPSPAPIGLSLSLASSELVAGDIVPVETTVRVTDAATHDHVRLTWLLPPWVEILRADPPLTGKGTVDFGLIRPGQDARSRLHLRIRATPGSAVPFSFRVDDGDGPARSVFTGSEARRVASSAIRLESVFLSPAVAPGGLVPLRVSNVGAITAPALIVRLMRADLAPQSILNEGGEARIGSFPPGGRQTLYLRTDPAANGTASFDFEVQDASRPINLAHLTVPIVDAPGISILSAEPTHDGRSIDVTYRATVPASIAVLATSRPSSTQDIVTVDIEPERTTTRIPLPDDVSTRGEWMVIPFEKRDGATVIGYGKRVGIGVTLPFTTRVRYYAEGGDQLGVGPVPPRVGEQTTYWVVLSLGPTSSPLRAVALSATLGRNVRPTGRHASVIAGDFSSSVDGVTWTIPTMNATPAEPATFAFEISFTPQSSDRGREPTLVVESRATALDASTGALLSASDSEHTTNLTNDPLAEGDGRVE